MAVQVPYCIHNWRYWIDDLLKLFIRAGDFCQTTIKTLSLFNLEAIFWASPKQPIIPA